MTATAPRFPLCAAEHPKFDQSTLPEVMPAGFDDSTWVNDTCPSFVNEGAGLVLFVDYTDPAQKEVPEGPLFTLAVWDGGATGEEVAASDDWGVMQVEILAALFAAGLREEIGAENFAAMRLTNVTAPEGVCASHDHCDSNMVMLEAFEAVTAREMDVEKDFGSDLWNAGWELAMRRYLTATAEEALTAEFAAYLEAQDLAFEGDAMEMIMAAPLTDDQRAWISDFILRWDAMRAAEDAAA